MKTIKKILGIEHFGELFHLSKIKELCIRYREILLYIVFGVVTTVVNWLVYAAMVRLLKVDLSAFSADGVIRLLLTKEVSFGTFFQQNGKELTALFAANLVAWVAGVLVAFFTNKKWVFQSKVRSPAGVLKELSLFTASRLITGLLEWFGLPLAIILGLNQRLFGVEGFAAKIIISIIVVILNYVFSKCIVFRKKRADAQTTEEKS